MAIAKAEIQTPFVGGGVEDDDNRRARFGDHFEYYVWRNITGVFSERTPNIYTIYAELEDAELALVESSDGYWVNWAETIDEVIQPVLPGVPMSGEEPTQARHDAMSAWMLAKGNTQATIDLTLGPSPAGSTAADIGERVYLEQRTLPPGIPPPAFAFGVTAQRGPYYQGGLQGIRIRLDGLAQDVVPNAIAMARYSEPDASGTFLGTSGGCVWNPIDEAWYSPGLLEPDASVPAYLAILYGSSIYLAFTLPGNVLEISYVANGGSEVPPPAGGWVESGATVTGVAGAATMVSDVSPFAVTDPLMRTRINGIEQEINSVGSTWINLIPYQNPPHANGSTIEIWSL